MQNKHIIWTMFVFTLMIGLVFMAILVRLNYDLTHIQNQTDNLQTQIKKLEKENEEVRHQLSMVNKTTTSIEKDIDTTQELQRIQAQKIIEIIKKRK